MFTGVVNHMLLIMLCLKFGNHNMLNNICQLTSIDLYALFIYKKIKMHDRQLMFINACKHIEYLILTIHTFNKAK